MEVSGLIEFIKWGWTVLAAHNWYLHRRADHLQQQQTEFVKRKELDDTVNSLRAKIDDNHRDLAHRFDESRREMTERFDRLYSHLIKDKS